MSIKGQHGDWLWARPPAGQFFNSHSVTIQTRGRDILAEIALSDTSGNGGDFFHGGSFAYISELVHGGGTNVGRFRPAIFLRDVYGVTFSIIAINTYTSARFMVHYWS